MFGEFLIYIWKHRIDIQHVYIVKLLSDNTGSTTFAIDISCMIFDVH